MYDSYFLFQTHHVDLFFCPTCLLEIHYLSLRCFYSKILILETGGYRMFSSKFK